MAKYNAQYYIDTDDFEGAVDRFSSTTKNWKKYWFDVCVEIAENCKEWLKKYVLDPIAMTIEIKAKRSNVIQSAIDENGVDMMDSATQKCYLFRFYDINNELVCSKVGTTIRKVRQRLSEELRSDTYKKMGCVRAVVDRVYDCKNLPAEGMESFFRALYIRKFPDSFKKNDRFIHVEFDLEEADRIVNTYMTMAV